MSIKKTIFHDIDVTKREGIIQFSLMRDFEELQEEQNNKSKLIIEEYNRDIREKIKNIDNRLDIIINKLLILKNMTNKLVEQNKIAYENNDIVAINQIDKELNDVNEMKISYYTQYNKLINTNKYPEGNGIFGYALAYYEASKRINVEWNDYIWTKTIIGYKKIYPSDAIDYLQYIEDIKTSDNLMKQIYQDMRLRGINIYEVYYDGWIENINYFLDKNNIEVDENIIFRPHIHKILINDEDRLCYYRITKNELDITSDDENYDILFDILNNGFENATKDLLL